MNFEVLTKEEVEQVFNSEPKTDYFKSFHILEMCENDKTIGWAIMGKRTSKGKILGIYCSEFDKPLMFEFEKDANKYIKKMRKLQKCITHSKNWMLDHVIKTCNEYQVENEALIKQLAIEKIEYGRTCMTALIVKHPQTQQILDHYKKLDKELQKRIVEMGGEPTVKNLWSDSDKDSNEIFVAIVEKK